MGGEVLLLLRGGGASKSSSEPTATYKAGGEADQTGCEEPGPSFQPRLTRGGGSVVLWQETAGTAGAGHCLCRVHNPTATHWATLHHRYHHQAHLPTWHCRDLGGYQLPQLLLAHSLAFLALLLLHAGRATARLAEHARAAAAAANSSQQWRLRAGCMGCRYARCISPLPCRRPLHLCGGTQVRLQAGARCKGAQEGQQLADNAGGGGLQGRGTQGGAAAERGGGCERACSGWLSHHPATCTRQRASSPPGCNLDAITDRQALP